MIIFLDTECTDLLPQNGIDAGLISIGLVDESGCKTFYAELTDTFANEFDPATHSLPRPSDFVRENVLPLLQGREYRMSLAECRERLRTWLESFHGTIQLLSDSFLDWEWMVFLFRDTESPKRVYWRLHRPQSTEALSLQESHHKHHALHDAIGLQRAWALEGGSREALDDTSLAIPHEEVMAKARAIIDQKKNAMPRPTTSLVRVSMVENRLVATLPDGETLSFDTGHSRDLADALFAHGFDADHVRCADWRESDGIGAGHCIAIKSRLRELFLDGS